MASCHIKSIWTLIRLCVSVSAVALVFYVAPVGKIANTVVSSHWPWLVPAIILQLMLRVMTAVNMSMLANFQGLNLGFVTMLRIAFATAFYGLFLPGGLAGGTVTFAKYIQLGAGAAASLINIMANKGIGVLAACVLSLCAWFYERWDQPLWLPIAGPLLLMLSLFLLRGVCSGFGSLAWLIQWLDRRSGALAKQAATVCRQLNVVAQLSWQQMVPLFIAAILLHVIAAAAMLMFAAVLDILVPLATLIWVYGVIFLVSLLPISFANLGVREASMIILLRPSGITAEEVTAWSILMYSGPLTAAVIGGLMETLGSQRLSR